MSEPLRPLPEQLTQLRVLAWGLTPDTIAGMTRGQFVDQLCAQASRATRDAVSAQIRQLKQLATREERSCPPTPSWP